MKPPKFKHRLQTIIPLSFIILLFAMAIVVIYTTREIIRPILIKQYEHQIEDAGNMIVAEINGILGQAETVAIAIADVTASLGSDEQALKQVVPSLLNRHGYETFIAGGGVWPEPFKFDPKRRRRSFFWGRDQNGTLKYYDDYNAPQGPGYHQEEWYVPAKYLPEDKAIWSRAYIDPYSKQPMVTCAVPVRRGDEFVGAATVDLKLEGLATLFSQAAQTINGYIFVVDRNNRFLTFPKEELVCQKLGHVGSGARCLQKFITTRELADRDLEFRPVAKELAAINRHIIDLAHKKSGYRKNLASILARSSYQIDQREAKLIAAIIMDPLGNLAKKSNRLKSFYIDRDVLFHEAALTTIFNMPETYWKVVITVPEKAMTAPVNRMINRIIFSLLILLSFILIAANLLFHRHLVKPLRAITSQLKKIEEDSHDLSLKLDIPSDNELGELAYYFNKRTEALRNSEEKHRTIFNGAGEGISLSTLEGTFIAVNPRFAEIFGYDSPDEFISQVRTPNLYLNIEDREAVINPLKEGQDSVHCEIWLKKRDGTPILASLNLGAVKDKHGQIMYLIAMIQDITRNKKLEAELRHAQKMEAIGTLAGGIAHDFNNILAAISGYNELAQLKAGNDETLANYLSQIGIAVERARALVQQILAVSRKSKTEKRSVQPAAIVREALKLLRSTLPSTIEIKTEIASTSPILADPSDLHQIIMNLCTNAYHAMLETGGILSVRLTEKTIAADIAKILKLRPGTYVYLEIRDTGCGMDEKTLNKIFEPYFTTKGKEQGTGLGLAVVHGIITSLEGAIKIDSNPGQGTVVQVYLPVIEDESSKIPSASSPEDVRLPATGNGERIMFVDDEEMICEYSKVMLEKAGFRVETFMDSTEAYEVLRANPDQWDLLITDMTMPGLNGEELIKRVNQFLPDLPIILCTGYSQMLTDDRLDQLLIQAFLQKPVARNVLLRKVIKILKQNPS